MAGRFILLVASQNSHYLSQWQENVSIIPILSMVIFCLAPLVLHKGAALKKALGGEMSKYIFVQSGAVWPSCQKCWEINPKIVV